MTKPPNDYSLASCFPTTPSTEFQSSPVGDDGCEGVNRLTLIRRSRIRGSVGPIGHRDEVLVARDGSIVAHQTAQ